MQNSLLFVITTTSSLNETLDLSAFHVSQFICITT
jgi:hypothetical protein